MAVDRNSSHPIHPVRRDCGASRDPQGARWDEISIEVPRWTIPACKVKAGREFTGHSARMRGAYSNELGRGRPTRGWCLRRGPASRCRRTQGAMLRRAEIAPTVHGSWSSVRLWMAESGVATKSRGDLACPYATSFRRISGPTCRSAVPKSYRRGLLPHQRLRESVVTRWLMCFCGQASAMVARQGPPDPSPITNLSTRLSKAPDVHARRCPR